MADRNVLVRLRANADQFNREMLKARAAVAGLGDEINTSNDRTAWLAQGIAALGPAIAPIGAVAVPLLMGLATQATVGAGAIGTMALAFSGVGDALDALNKYQLEPTAENLAAMREAMGALGPDGAEFVRFLDQAGEQLRILQMDARAGMFPGMIDGIESLLEMLPRLRSVVQEISSGVGTLARDAGAGLAGPEFEAFFEYLKTDAQDILVTTGRTIGNFFDGFASMIVAFGPLTEDFSNGLLNMSRDFEQWAENLGSSQGFAEFTDYVREAGPMLLDFVGSLTNAAVEIGEAAAPVADLMVPALSALLDVIATLADTPLGSLALMGAALASLYGRTRALGELFAGDKGLGSQMQRFRDGTAAAGRAALAGGKQAAAAAYNWKTFAAGIYAAHVPMSTLQGQLKSTNESTRLWAQRMIAGKGAMKSFGDSIVATTRSIGPTAGTLGLFAASASGLSDSVGLANTTSMALLGTMLAPGWGTAAGAIVGGFMDMQGATKDFASVLDAANEALDDSSTPIDVLRQRAADLKKELLDLSETDGFGDWISDGLKGGSDKAREQIQLLEQLGNQIAFLKAEAGRSRGGMHGWIDLMLPPLDGVKRSAHLAAMSMKEFSDAARRAFAIFDKQAALDSVEAAFDNARQAVKEFGNSVDNSTNAGRQVRAAFRGIAEDVMVAAEHMKGAARADYLQEMRGRLLDLADAMGVPERFAKRLADALVNLDGITAEPEADLDIRNLTRKQLKAMGLLHLLDDSKANPFADMNIDPLLRNGRRGKAAVEDLDRQKASPDVKLDGIQPAISSANALESSLNRIDGTYTAKVNIVRDGALPPLFKASGGHVRGPGTETSDSIPAMLSDNEYVIRAAAVRRYGVGFFDRANSMKLASGGPVGSSRMFTADDAISGLTAALNQLLTSGPGWGSVPLSTEWVELDQQALLDRRRHLTEMAKELAKERDLLKSRIEAIKAEQDAIRQAVADRVTADPFGDAAGVGQWVVNGDDLEFVTGPATFDSSQDALNDSSRDGAELIRLIKELKKKGFDGPALAMLLSTGDIETIRDFAAQTRADLRQYELDFERNRAIADQAGQLGVRAEGRLGDELGRSRKELERLNDESKHINKKLERVNKRLDAMHKTEQDQPKDTGREVAKALTGVVGNARRRQP